MDDTELAELIRLLCDMTYKGQDLRGEKDIWEAIDRAVNWISAPYEDDVQWYVEVIRAGPRES